MRISFISGFVWRKRLLHLKCSKFYNSRGHKQNGYQAAIKFSTYSWIMWYTVFDSKSINNADSCMYCLAVSVLPPIDVNSEASLWLGNCSLNTFEDNLIFLGVRRIWFVLRPYMIWNIEAPYPMFLVWHKAFLKTWQAWLSSRILWPC